MLETRCRGEHRCGIRYDAGGNDYVETDPSGRYGRFDKVLGRGATKTVYKAFDELNGIEVAWYQAKVIDVLQSPEVLERLYSEVNLLKSFNHESIIRYQESWIDSENRTFNFITEMFTSGTLREYRQKYRRIDIRAIKSWARQILHGLVYLHSHDPPVIHRDIKCDNIFVNGHLGQVKIGDLGLAAVLRGCQSAHSVIGTPEFMAPELYEEDYNELVDIYSFGMCVLEILTSEYPYGECSNPAQIYRKVTKGKLPDSFHRLQHPEAKRFIGRCLEEARTRPSAKELLLDPFLALDDHQTPLLTMRVTGVPEVKDIEPMVRRASMNITGKLNPKDDAIILKVQIVDKDGQVRNIYFPFDIVSDNAEDVANEMVKELELTDREPSEIAEMIAQEISMLVPGWREGSCGQDVYDYEDDGGDGSNHQFCYLSSPTASSQGSIFGPGHSQGIFLSHIRDHGQFTDDDDSSSCRSGMYSAINYTSEHESERRYGHYREAQPSTSNGQTRFGNDEAMASDHHSMPRSFLEQCSLSPESSYASSSVEAGRQPVQQSRRLTRNRSMVDLRSQLLHRALVEELNKRMFKTVSSAENIGF